MPDQPSEFRCSECGVEQPANRLEHASIPPFKSAMGVINTFDLDSEPAPPSLFVDRQWYCQPCLRRVQSRRIVAYLLFGVVLIAVVILGVRSLVGA